jgi:hypothetical protein
MILVDTNIPPRIAQVGHTRRQAALVALERLTLRDQEHFAIAPQSLYELDTRRPAFMPHLSSRLFQTRRVPVSRPQR